MDLSTRQGRREQGQLIQKAVERTGLSVEELANRIGCSRALIYQYLSGTTLAQPDRLQQIAVETGVTLSYFYGAPLPEEPAENRRAPERDSTHARLTERIHQMEELARAQESNPDWSALASTCERIISLASQADDDPAEARALLRLGKARIRLGEFSRAADCLSRAATAFAAQHEERGEADARQALGNALLATGRHAEACEQFERVSRSSRWEARWSGEVSLAAVCEQFGDYRQAMEHCDEAASILEEGRSTAEIATGMLYVNANRVNIYLACGDFMAARPLAERCLEEAEAMGNSDQHLEARLNVGICALWQGHWAVAHRTLSLAIQLARFVGDRSREAMARAAYGILLAALCDCDPCIQQAKDALAAALSQGDHRAELFAQMALADAYTSSDRHSEALYHASQALAVANSMRLVLYEVEARLRLARMCLRNSSLSEAGEHIERAQAGAQRLGARHLEAVALLLSGQRRLRAGDAPGALEDAATARTLARELAIMTTLWEIEALRAQALYAQTPSDLSAAEQAARDAIRQMEAVRQELREAGISDTLLEDRERQDIYLLLARLLEAQNRNAEAEDVIEQAGWPPLTARFQGRVAG